MAQVSIDARELGFLKTESLLQGQPPVGVVAGVVVTGLGPAVAGVPVGVAVAVAGVPVAVAVTGVPAAVAAALDWLAAVADVAAEAPETPPATGRPGSLTSMYEAPADPASVRTADAAIHFAAREPASPK
jgi:hypothetical protein